MDEVEERLGKVEQRLDAVQERLGKVEQRLDEVEERLDSAEERIAGLEQQMRAVNDRLGKVEEQVADMNKRLAAVELESAGMDKRLARVERQIRNEAVPRLKNIESCYVGTFERYSRGAEQMEAAMEEMEILHNVVDVHHSRFEGIAKICESSEGQR